MRGEIDTYPVEFSLEPVKLLGPKIILLTGFPYSGKTSVGKKLFIDVNTRFYSHRRNFDSNIAELNSLDCVVLEHYPSDMKEVADLLNKYEVIGNIYLQVASLQTLRERAVMVHPFMAKYHRHKFDRDFERLIHLFRNFNLNLAEELDKHNVKCYTINADRSLSDIVGEASPIVQKIISCNLDYPNRLRDYQDRFTELF